MNCKKLAVLSLSVLLLCGLLCGCGDENPAGEPAEDLSGVAGVNADDQFTDRDMDGSGMDSAVSIVLADDASKAGSGVSISDNVVTIYSEGAYALSGSLSNGRVVVDAPKDAKIQLVLKGVSVTADGFGALYVRQADKVFVTLAEGTQNAFVSTSDSTSGVEENVDGTIFSKDDVTFNGAGSLTVTGPGHGVVVKAGLAVTGGTYAITAEGGHAIQAKKDARFADGQFTLTAGKDGVHVENPDNAEEGYLYVAGGTFAVTADGDGFSAATLLQVADGAGTLTCGGGSINGETHHEGFGGGWGGWGNEPSSDTDESTSAKGFKGGTGVLVQSGEWTMDTADDGLHSNGDLTVSGGDLTIATGDDGLHADGLLVIKDGVISVSESYEGIEGNAIEILGGTITVVASDDGLNAAGGNDGSGFGGGRPDQFSDTGSNSYIRIAGGKLIVDADGDGIDSNHSVYVDGGETYVSGPTGNGNGALDYDRLAKVTGGVFVAVGSRGMAQGFSEAEGQGALLVTAGGTVNDAIVLTDSKGNELFRWTPLKNYETVVISCPGLEQGKTYTLTVGDAAQTIEMTEWIYGNSGGMGGPGSGRPDGGPGGGPGGGWGGNYGGGKRPGR